MKLNTFNQVFLTRDDNIMSIMKDNDIIVDDHWQCAEWNMTEAQLVPRAAAYQFKRYAVAILPSRKSSSNPLGEGFELWVKETKSIADAFVDTIKVVDGDGHEYKGYIDAQGNIFVEASK